MHFAFPRDRESQLSELEENIAKSHQIAAGLGVNTGCPKRIVLLVSSSSSKTTLVIEPKFGFQLAEGWNNKSLKYQGATSFGLEMGSWQNHSIYYIVNLLHLKGLYEIAEILDTHNFLLE